MHQNCKLGSSHSSKDDQNTQNRGHQKSASFVKFSAPLETEIPSAEKPLYELYQGVGQSKCKVT